MEKSNLRKPAVAGQFYPASREELAKLIKSFIPSPAHPKDAFACMLPHAGYVYSGEVAAITLSRVSIKRNVILLGPNHTGYGSPFSIAGKGSWLTPLGEVLIQEDLAKKLMRRCPLLEDDPLAHAHEHSLEVELPLLQYLSDDFSIVPIAILSGEVAALKQLGKDIAQVIKEEGLKGSTLLIASSDMTHYEPQLQAQKKDETAIQAILELNEDLLIDRIRQFNISMCGFAPAVAMLAAAKALGAGKAELAEYRTSGDVTGDTESVVGYAGIIIR